MVFIVVCLYLLETDYVWTDVYDLPEDILKTVFLTASAIFCFREEDRQHQPRKSAEMEMSTRYCP